MKIVIGSDHGGYESKNNIIKYLKELNYNVEDVGPYILDSTDDYPIYAKKVCSEILKDEDNLGILICTSGIGMSIAANKIKGIRCAKVDNAEEAKISRLHNNANVMSLSSYKTIEEMQIMVLNFIENKFSNEERHIRRINEIENF